MDPRDQRILELEEENRALREELRGAQEALAVIRTIVAHTGVAAQATETQEIAETEIAETEIATEREVEEIAETGIAKTGIPETEIASGGQVEETAETEIAAPTVDVGGGSSTMDFAADSNVGVESAPSTWKHPPAPLPPAISQPAPPPGISQPQPPPGISQPPPPLATLAIGPMGEISTVQFDATDSTMDFGARGSFQPPPPLPLPGFSQPPRPNPLNRRRGTRVKGPRVPQSREHASSARSQPLTYPGPPGGDDRPCHVCQIAGDDFRGREVCETIARAYVEVGRKKNIPTEKPTDFDEMPTDYHGEWWYAYGQQAEG
ncbi:hypothetical protein BSKO_13660 [Bryopsis sp. KO-2023]|nr:hypothetical protein BSKO_13660 [Bryopsis sp. KO-2023]